MVNSKIITNFLLCLGITFSGLLPNPCYAQMGQAQDLTVTALYLAPYAAYNIVRTKRVIDIDEAGNTFFIDASGRSEFHQMRLNDFDANENASIEADEKGDLLLAGKIYGTYTIDEYYIDLNEIEPWMSSDPADIDNVNASVYVNSLRTKSFIAMGAFSPYQEVPPVTGKHVYDLAEAINAENCEVCDVVIISQDKDVTVVCATTPYDLRIAGVISEYPKFHMGGGPGMMPLALAGIVECKVGAENGSIKRGDLLVSSSIAGHAMRADENKVKPGMVVGSALAPLENGTGKILILVNQ